MVCSLLSVRITAPWEPLMSPFFSALLGAWARPTREASPSHSDGFWARSTVGVKEVQSGGVCRHSWNDAASVSLE